MPIIYSSYLNNINKEDAPFFTDFTNFTDLPAFKFKNTGPFQTKTAVLPKTKTQVLKPKPTVEKKIVKISPAISTIPKKIRIQESFPEKAAQDVPSLATTYLRPTIIKGEKEISETYEISNRELIEHYGFQKEKVTTSNWLAYFKKQKIEKQLVALANEEKNRLSSMAQHENRNSKRPKVASIIVEQKEPKKEKEMDSDTTVDQVKLPMASVIKKVKQQRPRPLELEEELKKSDDNTLPVAAQIHHPPKKAESPEILSSSSISSINKDSLSHIVRQAIHREYSKTQSVQSHKSHKILVTTQVDDQMDSQKNGQSIKLVATASAATFGHSKDYPKSLSGRLVAYRGGRAKDDPSSKIYNYYFEPDYDSNKSLFDYGNGFIQIEEKFNSPMSVVSGVILTKEMMRTRMNWMLTLEDQKLEVPLWSKTAFYDFLKHHGLRGEGGNLMVKRHEAVRDINIDGDFERRFFLDEQFKINNGPTAQYILYVGVEPGNRLIKYLTFNRRVSEKVVFLSNENGEIFYDDSYFLQPQLEKIKLYEKKIMGKQQSELMIEGNQLTYFNKDIHASIVGPNLYEYLRPQLSTGNEAILGAFPYG